MALRSNSTKDATVHFDLGFAYAEMRLRKDAISELEAGLRLDPEHRDAGKARALLLNLKHHLP